MNKKIVAFWSAIAICGFILGVGKPGPSVDESQLKAVIEPFRALNLGHEGASDTGGFVKTESSDPVVTNKSGGTYSKLGCSPFVNAVLHRLKTGSYRGLKNGLHSDYGADQLASAYGLKPVVAGLPWTVEELHQRLTKPTKDKPAPADGVYMFDVRLQKGWTDGRGTSFPKKEDFKDEAAFKKEVTDYNGHVGFVVIDGTKVCTYQMTSVVFDGHKDGLAFGLDFVKWLEAKNVYFINKATARIDLYRVEFK